MVLFAFLLVSVSSASNEEGTVEFFFGKYYMEDARFKTVYQGKNSIQGIILSTSFIFDFNLYMEVKPFYKMGQLTYTKEKTEMVIVPVSFGARYILPLRWINPYFGGGGDYYLYYETNPIGTVMDYAIGYHLSGGVYFQFLRALPLRLNVRVKYTKADAIRKERAVELGGWEYGLGLAFVF